jgi:hypothetical protein
MVSILSAFRLERYCLRAESLDHRSYGLDL